MPDTARMLEIISGRRRGAIAGLWRVGLGILTPVYRVAIWFRNRAFDLGWKKIEAAEVPVISIGNLTTGGTGKTPFVIWVARLLREQGVRVCILSRGYRPIEGRTNDESLELQRAMPDVPVLENPDRVASARIAVEELEMEALVLDDGFQHRRLARALNIVLVDATNPFGFGRLLPRGLLREPVSSLRRSTHVVITRANLVSQEQLQSIRMTVKRFASNISIVQTVASQWVRSDGQSFPLDHLSDQISVGFCAIGNPEGFWAQLREHGLRLERHQAWPDHHHFKDADFDRLAELARDAGATAILCTIKDLVKIPRNRIGQFPLFALETKTVFCEGEQSIRADILDVAGRKSSGTSDSG